MYKKIVSVVVLALGGIVACTTTDQLDLSGMSFSDEPLVGKVVWYDLMTEDLDAAEAFYGGLFGWSFESTAGPGGHDYLVARSGNTFVAGLLAIEKPSDGTSHSRWLPYISVSDVDDALARGAAGGATIAVSARNVNFGRVAAVIDPDGAVIGLARSAVGDPDDRTTAPAAGRPVWTELLAGDAVAAADFYQEMVGLEVRNIERRGGIYKLLEHRGVGRAGILTRPEERITPVWVTFFGVEDPAAAGRQAEELGGTLIMAASQELRGGTMAIVTDPSGAVLVLQKWNDLGGEG